MTNKTRLSNVAALSRRGFRVSKSLPLVRDAIRGLRPVEEIASRLMALDAIYTWVVYDESETPAAKLRAYIKRNRLERWMTPKERKILRQERTAARRAQYHRVGWNLENMWPLAWALGFPRVPSVDGKKIPRPTALKVVAMLPRLTESVSVLLGRAKPRTFAVVSRLEDFFYCCHNAVRSAQLNGSKLPARFDPVVGGSVIQERRHALTWCLSPETQWDDTDLST